MRNLKSLSMKGHEIRNGLVLRGLYERAGSKLKIEVNHNREFDTHYLCVCEPYSLTGQWIIIRSEKLSKDCTLRQLDTKVDEILADRGL